MASYKTGGPTRLAGSRARREELTHVVEPRKGVVWGMRERGKEPLGDGDLLHWPAARRAGEAAETAAAEADGTLAHIHLHIPWRRSGPRLVAPALRRRLRCRC